MNKEEHDLLAASTHSASTSITATSTFCVPQALLRFLYPRPGRSWRRGGGDGINVMVPIIAIVESSLRKRGGCLPPWVWQAWQHLDGLPRSDSLPMSLPSLASLASKLRSFHRLLFPLSPLTCRRSYDLCIDSTTVADRRNASSHPRRCASLASTRACLRADATTV
jgi:hypothetical protein